MADRPHNGFTLVELVMTLVLLGILSAYAVPKFAAKTDFSSHFLFDDVLNAVRFGQKLAVVTRCPVKISIHSNQFILKRPASRADCIVPQNFTLDVTNPGSGESTYSGSESNISLTAIPASFYFTAGGTASADVTLNIAGKTISVISSTGYVYAN